MLIATPSVHLYILILIITSSLHTSILLLNLKYVGNWPQNGSCPTWKDLKGALFIMSF